MSISATVRSANPSATSRPSWTPWPSRVFAILGLVVAAVLEGRDMARAAHRRYPFVE